MKPGTNHHTYYIKFIAIIKNETYVGHKNDIMTIYKIYMNEDNGLYHRFRYSSGKMAGLYWKG